MTADGERRIDEFERAWQAEVAPDLAKFAAAADTATLRELVLIDLEYRWRRWKAADGDWLAPATPPGLETYARNFPSLTIDDELIVEEFRTRNLTGDRPTAAEFLSRFPDRIALPAMLAEATEELLAEAARSSPSFELPPADLPIPEVPTSVGAYKITGEIAAGATGTVYAAVHSTTGRAAAAKVIHPHLLADPEARHRFDREARLLVGLDHANVVRVLSVERCDGRPSIVMEFLTGRDLGRRIRDGAPMTIAGAMKTIAQAAAGLAFLHQRGIAHRDVSPSNLFLADDGTLKLIDLGLAKRFAGRSEPRKAGSKSSWVTPEGNALFGTPDFVAPETIRDGVDAGPSADVYGLGCTAFFLLAGRPPFPDGTPLEKLFQHLAAPPPDLSALRTDLPPAFDALLQRCLAKEPEARPTAEEVRATLGE